MNAKIRVGVIGIGRIGKLHAQLMAIHPFVNLTCLSDVDAEKLHALAEKLGVKSVSTHPHELLTSGIDAVVIASPTSTHAQLICDAARAGIHVFCEKPIALTVGRIHQALEAVADAGVKLQVGFNRRFDTDFRQLRNKIEEGAVGTTHILRITSRDPSPPSVSYVEASGGLFLDMMIHDFDMARYLIGDEVKEMYATGDALVDPEIGLAGDIDTAVVVMQFRNGTMCTIDNSRRAVYGYDQRAEVLGDRGCALTTAAHLNPGHFWDETAKKRDLSPNFFIKRYRAAYETELDEFISSIRDDQPPKVSGLDGLRAVELGMAAKASLAQKKNIEVIYS